MRTILTTVVCLTALASGLGVYGLQVYNDSRSYEGDVLGAITARKFTGMGPQHLPLVAGVAFYRETGKLPPQSAVHVGYSRKEFSYFSISSAVVRASERTCSDGGRPPVVKTALYRGRPPEASRLSPYPIEDSVWSLAGGDPAELLFFISTKGINGPGYTTYQKFSGMFAGTSATITPPADDLPPIDLSDCEALPGPTAVFPDSLKAVSSLAHGAHAKDGQGLQWTQWADPSGPVLYQVRAVATTPEEEPALQQRAKSLQEELAKKGATWTLMEKTLALAPNKEKPLTRIESYRYKDGTNFVLALSRQTGKLTLVAMRQR